MVEKTGKTCEKFHVFIYHNCSLISNKSTKFGWLKVFLSIPLFSPYPVLSVLPSFLWSCHSSHTCHFAWLLSAANFEQVRGLMNTTHIKYSNCYLFSGLIERNNSTNNRSSELSNHSDEMIENKTKVKVEEPGNVYMQHTARSEASTDWNGFRSVGSFIFSLWFHDWIQWNEHVMRGLAKFLMKIY